MQPTLRPATGVAASLHPLHLQRAMHDATIGLDRKRWGLMLGGGAGWRLRLLASIAAACVLGGTAAVARPALDAAPPAQTRIAPTQPGSPCWADDDGGGDDLLSPVMRAIMQCGEELGLSDRQAERLETLAIRFMQETLGRDEALAAAQLDLTRLLRPDPRDPGAPVDMPAAEAKIREIAQLSADQDIALLHVIEGSKAVLTHAQRARLATLPAEPAGATPAASGGAVIAGLAPARAQSRGTR